MQRTFETAVLAIGYVLPSLFVLLALRWFGVKIFALFTAMQALPM